MKIFKFGGASVKDADGVRNVQKIINLFPQHDLVVIISAMGKMTNAFEEVVELYYNKGNWQLKMDEIQGFHHKIIADLNGEVTGKIHEKVNALLDRLNYKLNQKPSENYDFEYDQIIGYGELLSTTIVSDFLSATSVPNIWADARELIRTNDTYREAKIDWPKTEALISECWQEVDKDSGENRAILLSQGFIGHTAERNTTTLGREGSDFTAAIFAYSLNADSLTIWKDVPGMLNADPKYFSDAVKLKTISFREAIELAYYGASVIHPKTIKPLQNKEIPLYVKSFLHPKDEGSLIQKSTYSDSLIPSYIFKVKQILISITPFDFSFVVEENLSEIFALFAKERLKIHLMQNSAINFSVCVDHDEPRVKRVIESLSKSYEVLFNNPCELVTIRHYNQETISRLLIGKKVLLEQRSRETARMVLMEAEG